MPLVPVVRRGTNVLWPLLPVSGGGPATPAPCSTIELRGRSVPVEVVCGPGAVAARPSPLLPVRGAPCRGSVELVSASAGVANVSASRVVGVKRFKIKRGRHLAVQVPLRPAARTLLSTTRVLRARAIVRSKAGRRKSKPFTILSRR
jgi:hypothetical protein